MEIKQEVVGNGKKKMNSFEDKEIGAACRFGPGGDFVSIWPSQSAESGECLPNRASRLLGTIGRIITTMLAPQLGAVAGAGTTLQKVTSNSISEKGNLEYAVEHENIANPSYPSPVRTAQGSSRFQPQPMLFSDDWRIGNHAWSKPKHYIRAHRGTAKKRHALVAAGQGSLFEVDFKSAKTA